MTTTIAPCDAASGESMAGQYRDLLSTHRQPLYQACRRCEFAQFPPKLLCPQCASSDLDWRAAEGGGTVQSWVTVHTVEATSGFAIPKWLRPVVPYSSVFVQLDELSGTLRLPSLMTGVDPAALQVGRRARLEVGGDDGRPVVVSRLVEDDRGAPSRATSSEGAA